jgi:hypothetical protein
MSAKKSKPEITLMTLLAYEATDDAQKLLKKYTNQSAKNFSDLEVKLGELYVKAEDKLKLEKEMARIHPHKKWIFERSEPVVTVEAKKTEVIATPIKEQKVPYLTVEEQTKQMQELKDELKKVLKEELEKSETKSNFQGNSWANQMPPNYYGMGQGMNAPIQMTLPLQPQKMSSYDGEQSPRDSKTQTSVAIGLAVVVGFIGASLWLNYQKAK